MAQATAFTSARSKAIEDKAVTGGSVDAAGNLTLTTKDGTAIAAGNVKGPKGDPGDNVDAKAYSDAGDATTLASAKSYSDGKLVEAKSYVDGHPLIKGVVLGNNVDMNTLTTNGFYTQGTNAAAATGTNYPRPLAGILEVKSNAEGTGVFVYQRYTIYGGYSPDAWVRTLYNGTWTAWTQAGPAGALVRVGRNLRTGNSTNTASEYNINTVTLPNPVNGDTYAVRAIAKFVPDTAGSYTGLRIRHGPNANIGGTQIALEYVDHRLAGRIVSVMAEAEFTYTGTTGATGYNVVSTGLCGGGSSYAYGATGNTSSLFVDKIL